MTTATTFKHGTYVGYKIHRCRCEPCVRANSRYRHHRKHEIAYGRWEPFVDAEPVRQHVERLRTQGLGWKRTAELAGVDRTVVELLLNGKPCRGKSPTKRVRKRTAEKLLAVRATLDVLGASVKVDGTGTRRRLQALVALGWSQSKLCQHLGVTPNNFAVLIRRDRVQASTARAVRALYDQLWDVAPPEPDAFHRGAATRARNQAARHGWSRPMAWDDDTIDDPDAKPSGEAAEQSTYRKLPQGEELLWLVDELGETHEALAERFEVEIKSVKSALIRARKKATSQNLETTA